MSKTVTAALAMAVVLTLAAAPASADRIDQRQYNQDMRIEQGLRDGSLTRYEAEKLRAEQDRIRAMERQAERDGKVTREERARLEAAQNQASRHIFQERHDGESRGSKWRRWGSNNNYGHEGRRWYRWW